MAIKNTLLGGTDYIDGEVLYAADQNDTNNAIIAVSKMDFTIGDFIALTGQATVDGAGITFADGADKKINLMFKAPSSWAGKQLKITIGWTTPATSGNCLWYLAGDNRKTGEASDTHTIYIALTDACEGNANYAKLTTVNSSTLTIEDGDFFRLEIHREGNASGDTLSNTATIIAFSIEAIY